MFGLTPYGKKATSLGRLEDPFNLFDSFFNESKFPFLGDNCQIKVDISENQKEFVIEAELPGYQKEDINIKLEDDRLTLTANKNEQTEEKGDNYIRRERRCGSVSRSFLVNNVNKEDVTAKFENGLLTVILPKLEQKQDSGTKIEIE